MDKEATIRFLRASHESPHSGTSAPHAVLREPRYNPHGLEMRSTLFAASHGSNAPFSSSCP